MGVEQYSRYATEYHNRPLALLTESATDPRRIFEETALKQLAESIRTHGILSPLLVRPLNERREIFLLCL